MTRITPYIKMTFVKVQDPTNKNLVKEYIEKRNRVREADRHEKMGRAFEYEELSRFFKPLTTQTRELMEQVGELPGKIAKAMPRQEQGTYEETPPPSYDSLPFAGEDAVPGEPEFETLDFPKEIKHVDDDEFILGVIPLIIDPKEKKIYVKKYSGEKTDINVTPNIYNLLTNKNAEIRWDDLNEKEQEIYGTLLTRSNIIENKKNPKQPNANVFPTSSDKWNLYAYVWQNRWLFKDDFTDQEYKSMQTRDANDWKNINPRPMQKTIDKVKELVKKQFGSKNRLCYFTE